MGFYNFRKLVYYIITRFLSKKTLIYIIVILCCLLLLSSNVFALSTADVSYSTDLNDKYTQYQFDNWLANSVDYATGDYYYIMGYCYNGSGSPESTSENFMVLVNKEDYNNISKHCYLVGDNSYNYLYYFYFSGNVRMKVYTYFAQTVGTDLTSNAMPYPFRTFYGSMKINSDIPIIYRDNTFTTTFMVNQQSPYIVTDYNDVVAWNFSSLFINSGTDTYNSNYSYKLYIENNGPYNVGTLDIDRFINVIESSNTYQFGVPRSYLSNYYVLKNNDNLHFYLRVFDGSVMIDDFDLGSFVLNAQQSTLDTANAESSKQLQSTMENNQQQTNEKLDNLQQTQEQTNDKLQNIDDTVNNPDVDNVTDDTLPQDTTEDITANAVDGLFTSIYNAFCTGEPRNIVFPIPFTNKSITLDPNYLRNSLTSANAGFLISFIEAFWWYFVSRIIIKDIIKKVNLIKSGNIEKLEDTNIKGDML